MGLRPEFALLCGMHPDNPYVSEDEKERWYIETSAGHVERLVRTYSAMLVSLWRDRADYKQRQSEQ